MEQLVQQSEKSKHQYELLQTVPGIGKQTAIALLVVTNGFTRLTESRKLSCYAGLAPFPYQSGSSVKGRTKISKMGDMKLKVLLNLSAWNAIRSITAFKDYFNRKVAEGKHKMSVINAVRNKLLALTLAVIKRNSPFEKNYSFS
jgi:transposase